VRKVAAELKQPVRAMGSAELVAGSATSEACRRCSFDRVKAAGLFGAPPSLHADVEAKPHLLKPPA
jgi:hypothetical protein